MMGAAGQEARMFENIRRRKGKELLLGRERRKGIISF
jgi:hypothetical protein